jgi:DNA-binding NarL/FixJ family response regulator
MDKPLHELLSDREYQVMCMIASGKTVKEIAKMLSLSVKTISTHRSRILRKMNMENNAQLTHYAIKQNLVD